MRSFKRVVQPSYRCYLSTTVTWTRPSDSASVPGLFFGSGSVGPKPGVIVLQEWWGITPEIQQQAEKIAQNGFDVIVPDLYRGKLGVDAEEASHLMSNLDFIAAVDDIRGAIEHLQSKDKNRKVGITGFCMGGALTLASAGLVKGIACAAPFYGIPDPRLCDPVNIKIPVQAHFGELDTMKGFSDPEAAALLKKKLEQAGVEHEVFTYQGVGHAFMNDTEAAIKRKKELGFGEHNQAHVEFAWTRLFQFLKKHLN
jgi:carboxymethylenebutenolidase